MKDNHTKEVELLDDFQIIALLSEAQLLAKDMLTDLGIENAIDMFVLILPTLSNEQSDVKTIKSVLPATSINNQQETADFVDPDDNLDDYHLVVKYCEPYITAAPQQLSK